MADIQYIDYIYRLYRSIKTIPMDTPSSGRPRPICLKPPAIAEKSVTFAVGSPARVKKLLLSAGPPIPKNVPSGYVKIAIENGHL